MKAITILQPWASLITAGDKRFETRSWKTPYRGPIAIHAGKKSIFEYFQKIVPKSLRLKIIDTLTKHGNGMGVLQNLPLGAVVATAELVECWRIDTTRPITGDLIFVNEKGETKSFADETGAEILFGDFTRGRYAWELKNVKTLENPIPAKGMQGLWEWEGSAKLWTN